MQDSHVHVVNPVASQAQHKQSLTAKITSVYGNNNLIPTDKLSFTFGVSLHFDFVNSMDS